jgi:hypothetical protein
VISGVGGWGGGLGGGVRKGLLAIYNCRKGEDTFCSSLSPSVCTYSASMQCVVCSDRFCIHTMIPSLALEGEC